MSNEFGEGKKYTRREFLRGPLDHYKNGGESAPATTNKIVESVGEGLSLLGIGYLAWRGSQDQLVTYKVNSESRLKNLPVFPQIDASLAGLSQIVEPTLNQAGHLYKVWEQAYTETTINASTDMDGNVTITTDTHWDEPYQLTRLGFDNYRINSWRNGLNGLVNNVRQVRVQVPEAFDLSNGADSIFYKEEVADTGGQVVTATAAYGIIGALFCLYEEGISSLTDDGSGGAFIADKKYIKRRTFLKLGTAAGMVLMARGWQRSFANENANLLQSIKANTGQVLDRINVTPEESFRRFLGTDPQSIRNTLADIRNKSETALNSGYNGDSYWNNVKKEVELTRDQAVGALSSFDRYFSYDQSAGNFQIPQELTSAARNIWGTKEISGFAESQSARIYTRHLADAFTMLLGLGGIVLVGEKLLFPLSEIVKNKICGTRQ